MTKMVGNISPKHSTHVLKQGSLFYVHSTAPIWFGLVWLYSNNKIKVTQNDARESGVEANGAIALQLVEAPGLVIFAASRQKRYSNAAKQMRFQGIPELTLHTNIANRTRQTIPQRSTSVTHSTMSCSSS